MYVKEIFNYHRLLICLLLSSFLVVFPTYSFSKSSVSTPTFKVAMFYPRDAPFWQTFTQLMHEAANDLNIELTTYSAKGNRLLMKQQFLSVLSGENKVDAVMFNNYKDSASQFIKLANDAKVYAFLVNSAMTNNKIKEMGKPREKYPYWIGQMLPDEAGANQKIIEILIDKAKLSNQNRPIDVIGINGPISSGAAIMRINALKDTLNSIPDTNLLQVVHSEDWSEKEASTKFKSLMRRYPGTQVVWAGSARMVDGILQAENEIEIRAGKDYFTGGVGFKNSMLEAIQNNRVSACAGGHYIEGAWALVLLYDYLNGKDFVSEGVELQTQMGIVNKENVAIYLENLSEKKWNSNYFKNINFKQYSKSYNPGLMRYDFDFDSIMLQLY